MFSGRPSAKAFAGVRPFILRLWWGAALVVAGEEAVENGLHLLDRLEPDEAAVDVDR